MNNVSHLIDLYIDDGIENGFMWTGTSNKNPNIQMSNSNHNIQNSNVSNLYMNYYNKNGNSIYAQPPSVLSGSTAKLSTLYLNNTFINNAFLYQQAGLAGYTGNGGKFAYDSSSFSIIYQDENSIITNLSIYVNSRNTGTVGGSSLNTQYGDTTLQYSGISNNGFDITFLATQLISGYVTDVTLDGNGITNIRSPTGVNYALKFISNNNYKVPVVSYILHN